MKRFLIMFLFFFLFGSACWGAEIIYSDLGLAGAYDTSPGAAHIIGGPSQRTAAASFTTAKTFTVTELLFVIAEIGNISAIAIPNLIVEIRDAMRPNAIDIETIDLYELLSHFQPPGPITLKPIQLPRLEAGTYWLMLRTSNPGVQVSWAWNSLDPVQTGVMLGGSDHEGMIPSSLPTPAFEIEGESVPEPGSMGAIAAGLALLFGARGIRRLLAIRG
jgi:hypothetical protein